ncbi:MAG: HAMP domain-containing sensor histidine kinase [Bacteroidia bacterium]|nr:HAMP domain-containing sensor histidine kinase [Bacteroidia bacterium]
MKKNHPLFGTLYWRISLVLLLILSLLGAVYLGITTVTAQRFLEESSQKLNGDIAQHTVQEVRPLVNGRVDTLAIQQIMHSMMIINPGVEVYLLDTAGMIYTYVAPYKKVRLDRVATAPIKAFIADPQQFIQGDDPRNPGRSKVFSAAPILEQGQLMGYIYIVLNSELQTAVTDSLLGSYVLQMGSWWFFIILAGALGLGLIALWYLTRNLRSMIAAVERFRDGDYTARAHPALGSDLGTLGLAFNEMADQIVANFDKIRSVENLRRELIVNISHDLRTPLSITRGYVETLLMKQDALSPEQRQHYLQIILDSSDRLSHLISQLFEYSKLEALQVEPQKEPFFIGELAQDIIARYQILAQKKQIHLHLDAAHDLPLVFADIALVERVFQNLLDNALKFTPSGGTISLGLVPHPGHVEITVKDTGIGVPEHEKGLIFERFRQASAHAPSFSGTGLGLAIVKKILELHQSTIRVENLLPRGAVFTFSLPAWG